jgi:hypothetical protein
LQDSLFVLGKRHLAVHPRQDEGWERHCRTGVRGATTRPGPSA